MGVREHRQRRLADKIVIVLGDPETHKTENYNIDTHATIALFYANIYIMNIRIYPYYYYYYYPRGTRSTTLLLKAKC